MIKVGTLCLIVGSHTLAGRVCTVTGWISKGDRGRYLATPGGGETSGGYYTIAVDAPMDPDQLGWGALPSQLRPLNDPDWTPSADEERERLHSDTMSHLTAEMRAYIRRLEREIARLLRAR